jgi:O-antigen ligase
VKRLLRTPPTKLPTRPHPAAAQRVAGEVAVWDAPFIGLVIFTFAIVTVRYPVAEIGIGVAALGLLLTRNRFRMPAFIWWFFGYLAWALLVSLISDYFDMAIVPLQERFKLLLIMIVAVNALRTPVQLRNYCVLFLVFFLIYPFRGAITNYVIGNTAFGRAIWNSIYSNPNDLAALSILALGVALSLGIPGEKFHKSRIFYLASAVLLAVLILLTQSRGAFLGTMIGIAWPLTKAIWRSRTLAVALVLGALLIVVAVPDATWQRFGGLAKLTNTETIAEADPEGSAEQRFAIAKVAWNIFLDNPIFGRGLESFSQVQFEYAPELGHRDTHNTYLNLGAELGLPGLFLWLGCVYSATRRRSGQIQIGSPDEIRFDAKWVRYALLSFLIAGVFASYSRLNLLYIFLSICWCAREMTTATTQPQNGNSSVRSGRSK